MPPIALDSISWATVVDNAVNTAAEALRQAGTSGDLATRGMYEANGSVPDWGTFFYANLWIVAACLFLLIGIGAYRQSQMATHVPSDRPARHAPIYKG